MSKKNRAHDRAARAAAALAEQRRLERRRRNLMVGGVVLGLVVALVLGWLVTRSLDTTNDVSAPSAGSQHGLTLGPDDAPHKVVVYEDFLCPYCDEFETTSRDELAKLAADGKVQVEYRPFNFLARLGDYSARSTAVFAVVLDTAGPNVAKKLHDQLFAQQPDEKGPFPSDDDLVAMAVAAGADKAKVEAGLADKSGERWTDAATQAAASAGVQATPTVLLDGAVFEDGRTAPELAKNLVARLR